MNIEETLRNLMIAKSGSVKSFAEMTELPYSTVLSILDRGVMNAKAQNVFVICEFLGIKPETLGEFDDGIISRLIETTVQLNYSNQNKVYDYAEKQLENQSKVIRIRENNGEYVTETLRGYLSAGTGEMQVDEISVEIEIPVDSLPAQPYDLILQINGDSMLPMFKDKERVFIRKLNEPSELRNGQIGVFIIDGESFLKKAYKEDNQLRLVSLNDKYNDLVFNKENNIEVVGTVVM